MTVGVLLLLFVAFQLWGTGLHEAKAQAHLTHQFDELLASTTTEAPTTTKPGTPTTLPPKTVAKVDIAPDIGEPAGRIEIPKLQVNKIFVQGDSLEQLDRAPGHYPATPFPGQAGNAAIAGHRTTYGAPFSNVDKLNPGDKIIVTTIQGRFTYAVQKVFIVQPDDVWVLNPVKGHPNTLTLTACHPKYDLAQRIVVQANLEGTPVPHMAGQDEAARHYKPGTLADGVAKSDHRGAWLPMIGWGLLCLAIWLVTWAVSRRWRRADRHVPPRWLRATLPYVAGVPLFLLTLFLTFDNLSQLLPAGL